MVWVKETSLKLCCLLLHCLLGSGCIWPDSGKPLVENRASGTDWPNEEFFEGLSSAVSVEDLLTQVRDEMGNRGLEFVVLPVTESLS